MSAPSEPSIASAVAAAAKSVEISSLGGETCEKLVTHLLALATRFSADTAVLHVLGVSIALAGTDATRLRARLDDLLRERRLELTSPVEKR